MDEQTINDELDFEASDSTTEQTPEANDSPDNTNEQAETLGNIEQTETAPDSSQVEGTEDGAQVDNAVLEHFLESKGIKLDEPEINIDNFLKLGKMAYNSERQFKRNTQELAELKRQLENATHSQNSMDQNSQNQLSADTNQNDTAAIVEQFQNNLDAWIKEKNLTPEEDAKMQEWLSVPVGVNPMTKEPILRAHLFLNGVFSPDDVYQASGCGMIRANSLKNQMMDEVKKEMAARQNAKRPAANATNSAQFGDKQKNDPFLEGLLED